ncbi:MAG TPA: exonuclease domain-containing protein [Candidatus Accumulibacter phosphatis]|nr:exonuclease domain-containing protein [Candidatus Accumulibacter phosphatis]HRQ96378.1 exonuclease domain-containing protein [Candidatus Accumulibacter phosphatis]
MVFVDLETSGANFANDRIIEIGLVEVDPDGVREWSVLVNPEMPLSPFITSLTGISEAMLRPAPTFRQIAQELLERLRGRLFVAHNARFDYGFLKGEFGRLGVDFRLPSLCTVKLSRKLYPEHHRHNLDTLVDRHGLAAGGGRHRALADARLLWALWQCWHRNLPVTTIRDAVAAIVGRPELPPQLDPAPLEDLPEAAGAYAFYGEHGRLLLSRRSDNLRRQVLAHFAAGSRDKGLCRETWRIEWREAAGELGARLHEMRFTREAPPTASAKAAASPGSRQRLAVDEICSWQLQLQAPGDYRPRLVFGQELDFAVADDLFGLYTSRREAQRALRVLAEANQLCQKQVGIEQAVAACSGYRQKNCRGACIGKEAVAQHSARLMTALARLRIRSWPYRGPVALIERDDFGMRQDIHLIDRWRLLGTVRSEEALQALLAAGPSQQDFDPDIYRIISRFLNSGKVAVRPLPAFSL